MSDTALRLVCFGCILASMVILEKLSPASRARTRTAVSARWFNHFGLVVLGSVLAKLAVPAGLTGIAVFAEQKQWGLFYAVGLHGIFGALLGLVLLDILIYWQHRLFHRVPLLWRLHRVHHADPNVDVTSAVRFHPFELLLSLGIKVAAVVSLGLSPETVLVFEIVLSSLALFNHSNIKIPQPLESILRWFLITPALHRVHHSILKQESHRNFGFSVPYWDHLFGSYQSASKQHSAHYRMGVKELNATKETLISLCTQPLDRGAQRTQ